MLSNTSNKPENRLLEFTTIISPNDFKKNDESIEIKGKTEF